MLLPPLVQRGASSFPGLAVIVLSWSTFETGLAWWFSAVIFLVGLWLSVRGYRMAVFCDDSSITIRGQLHTQRIAKQYITAIHTSIDGFPAVLWHRPGGRKRWSPILVFSGSTRELSYFHHHKTEQLERIRVWYIHDGPKYQPR